MHAITLDTINEINRLDQLARTTASEAVELARQAGVLLLKVKDQLPHGEFTQWLKTNVSVSQRQAQRYMAAAQGKPISIRSLTVKNDTVSLLDDQQKTSQNQRTKGRWMPKEGHMYFFKDAAGANYWVSPSIEPAGGYHVCKHYNGERLSSKNYFLHYTILSEIHDEDFTCQYYIGTRKPVSMKYGVGSVLQSYGLNDIEGSLLFEDECESLHRPFGEPDEKDWYWDCRHPDDEAFLQDLAKDGHINAHGAIVLDWREHQTTSQHQVG
ncbi:DUF3102 domain-containing protein [Polynucleobacter sp. 31A-FELB]|uniref:DUF3102 domain-containing protein n=1 Tax=Polynucleobacter sp. 31A-FELB TaxID=2689096 RepID=UPI001C0DCA20|nr:DUF3102 domain-containing protein [Polynucleobacter sp. 31A-FELB]MBU3587822.1 DUF3102 domain-containing protein [Polynucleobacter sp. 31A-FELB]